LINLSFLIIISLSNIFNINKIKILVFNLDNNKIKKCTILLNQLQQHLLNSEQKVRNIFIVAITKSNQPSSRPGPADYNVSKPLHKSGSIASTK
jgi:hypothetical protein